MNYVFYDLAEKIAEWHEATFEFADEFGQFLKLEEEFKEWSEANSTEDMMSELADCFIVASALWFRFHTNVGGFICKAIVKHYSNNELQLYAAIVAKMEVNKARQWKKQPNGSYHHLTEG